MQLLQAILKLPLRGQLANFTRQFYGLKQPSRALYAKLSYVLENVRFSRSNADSSLFVRIGSTRKLVVLIYIEDLIITSYIDEITLPKKAIHKQLAIKDLGRLKYFLSIEMATSSEGLFLNQQKYVMDLLHDSEMLDYKPASTLLDCKFKVDIEGEFLTYVSYYQRLVGKLIYLTIICPNITHGVSLVRQFTHCLTVKRLNVIKRILRYLKGSIGHGILMKNNGSTNIQGYTHADWAENALNCKSTTGYCTFL